MNDKGVCRTILATPVMLINGIVLVLAIKFLTNVILFVKLPVQVKEEILLPPFTHKKVKNIEDDEEYLIVNRVNKAHQFG